MHQEIFEQLSRCLREERLVALATVVSGKTPGRQMLVFPDGATRASLGSEELDARVAEAARDRFARFGAERLSVGDTEVFLEIHPPRSRLIVVGAVHVAVPLVTFAGVLGWRTVVVDPRTAFATRERFAHADELVTTWPDRALRELKLDESSYVALLSHDLKLDLPALEVALRSPARYVGALGSKKTHGKRVAALEEAGFTEAEISRIHNPIGLDLGGRRAEEIAVAIIAEMVAVDHGRQP